MYFDEALYFFRYMGLCFEKGMDFMQNQLYKQPSILNQLALVCGFGLLLGIAAIKIPMFLLFVGVAGVIYIMIAWFWPEIAILGILFFTSTIFDVYAYPSIPIGIGNLIISDILLFVLIGIIFLRVILRSSSYFIRTPLDKLLFAFYGTAILATIIGISNSKVTFNGSLDEVRKVNFYLVFFVVTNLVRNEKQLRRLISGIVFLSIFVALAMIAQYILGPSVPILPGRVETLRTSASISYGVTRVLPPGQSMVMLGFVCLVVQMLFNKSSSRFIIYLFQLGLVGLAVLLTFNRNFWGAIALALFLVSLLVSLRDKVKYVQIVMWVVLVGSFVLILFRSVIGGEVNKLVDGITARMSTLFSSDTANESSLQYRSIENGYAYTQIASTPFIGIGLGAAFRPEDSRLVGPSYIHNGHLYVILKTGLIGYLFFMWFLLLFIKRGLQNWRQTVDPFLKGIVLSFTVVIVGILAANDVNPIFMQIYWAPVIGAMLGVGEVIQRIYQNRHPDFHSLKKLN
jgi:O-antigen ligase